MMINKIAYNKPAFMMQVTLSQIEISKWMMVLQNETESLYQDTFN